MAKLKRTPQTTVPETLEQRALQDATLSLLFPPTSTAVDKARGLREAVLTAERMLADVQVVGDSGGNQRGGVR
jgi:hypothetical protein